jgi:hypothetical protein
VVVAYLRYCPGIYLEGSWVRDQHVNPIPSECCSLYRKSSSSVCPQVTAPVVSVRSPIDINAVYRPNNLKPSGHYMYRTVVTVCCTVVIMRTAQWSLCVPHSGHYVYCTVVTICTAQWSLCTAHWSLCVPHSGHYVYCTVVTMCTAQWSLCVPHSGHCAYRTVVTMCTARFNIRNSTFCPHSVFMCFVWI